MSPVVSRAIQSSSCQRYLAGSATARWGRFCAVGDPLRTRLRLLLSVARVPDSQFLYCDGLAAAAVWEGQRDAARAVRQ